MSCVGIWGERSKSWRVRGGFGRSRLLLTSHISTWLRAVAGFCQTRTRYERSSKAELFISQERRGVVARRERHCSWFNLKMLTNYCSFSSALIHQFLFSILQTSLFFTFDCDEMVGATWRLRYLCDTCTSSRKLYSFIEGWCVIPRNSRTKKSILHIA